MAPLVTHAAVTVALIAAYVVLTVTGHDGNALLAVLVGYAGGVGAQQAAAKEPRTGGRK